VIRTGMELDRAHFIAVDWSGALSGERRKIWIAEATGGKLLRLEPGLSRAEICNYLVERAERDPPIVVGLDFAFSFPQAICWSKGSKPARLCGLRPLRMARSGCAGAIHRSGAGRGNPILVLLMSSEPPRRPSWASTEVVRNRPSRSGVPAPSGLVRFGGSPFSSFFKEQGSQSGPSMTRGFRW